MGTKIVISTNTTIACGGASAKSVLGYKAPTGVAARVLRYGVSYWNYVGEPVHYILSAIEKQMGLTERPWLATRGLQVID